MQPSLIWSHLEALLAAGADPNRAEPYRKRLLASLQPLAPREVARLLREIHDQRCRLRQRSLWCAASLIRGSLCDDEQFSAFRAWLIAHGRAVVDAALNDPDTLARLEVGKDRDGRPEPSLLAINATPGKVYAKKVADDHELDAAIRAEFESDGDPDGGDDDSHIGWAYWSTPRDEELKRNFPALWTRYGEHWQSAPAGDDPAHPFADMVREVELPGLGRIGIGDTLVWRHDGRSFTVLGISDTSAMLRNVVGDDSDDNFCFGDIETRYIARIRDPEGRVHCNLSLSQCYLRRPDQPDSGPQLMLAEAEDSDADEADVDDAWSERSDAIQARLEAALAADGVPVRVSYCAYEEEEDGLPIDNLDTLAYRGRIRFVEVDFSDGERYESIELNNPTWIDVARAANQAILQLGYEDHIHLEGFEIDEQPSDGPAVASFMLGS